ncbi:pimeloyl-ACP methyl ester carboxylesterase [Aeromicrobium panaciterrae]|uniref:Pimeloyl-ACP methyl ester carboxylesterase n=1 Tax=Aeromicrobium panaciterrae TaxID=363861 RepID=A0ABU1UQP6_9ACTN|nr:alpha/beta fold hydrolase [Aeromicrobium panaciterrae]MDR7087488.1 pimeloyl-ACP methyl ester carboxylesterase [Aeromicrobium panaciterrae]
MTSERISQFRNGRYTFDVIDSGPLDGTPVVLLHGFPQRAAAWNTVASHLHERGLRTYAPDQRGYSPGARPRTRWGYRASQLRNDILALISDIGGPVHLVGHDWGSTVGWAVSAHSPQLVSTYTAVSVGHPAAFLRSMLSSNQLLKSYYMALFQLPVVPELVLKQKSPVAAKGLRNAGMTQEMVETYRSDILDYGALTGGIGWYRGLLFPPIGDIGGKVSVPTTMVWSDDDVALGRKGIDLTERYVTGPYELDVYKDHTHWLLDEAPERLAASIAKRIGV